MMPLHFPDSLDATTFLRDFWQKQPLLIRGGLAGYRCPLSAEELAGLACEEEIESRIVLEKDGVRPWEARTGPFDEEAFATLPPSHWTLLVQDVDKHIPEVAELLEPFRFLPDWRLDDIMISYAVDKGSVGPHIDDYDVFLIQAEGRRRWLIDSRPGSESNHIPGLDLRLLPDFSPEHEWLMEPGDVLYLPPNIPHWGVAEGDGCMTCSVGFRTPTFQEMASAWCDELIQHQVPEGRYRDNDIGLQDAPGEIDARALARVREHLQQFLLMDPDTQERWFGRFITEPKAHLQVEALSEPVSPEQFPALLGNAGGVERNGWSKFAFIRGRGDQDYLYVNGEEYPFSKGQDGFLETITNRHLLTHEELAPWLDRTECLQRLTRLFNHRHLLFDE
jgi:50S ribosomal protein L16 3-hydroxylase